MAVILLLLLTLQGIPSVAPTGTLHSPRVKESSGIAASRAHVGVLWTHNDSGDDAYVYATDLAGADRGVVRVRGARAVDWEDIALGPCPTRRGTCLYIADTGDNEMARKSVVIYAVAEPDPPDRQSGPVRSAPAAPCGAGSKRDVFPVHGTGAADSDDAAVGTGQVRGVHICVVP